MQEGGLSVQTTGLGRSVVVEVGGVCSLANTCTSKQMQVYGICSIVVCIQNDITSIIVRQLLAALCPT